MNAKKKPYDYKRNPSFYLPSIPKDEWCDFRSEYESGATLKEIAAKHYCDPRTVRRCISSNKPSTELGKQTEPTKLSPYVKLIETLFQELTGDTSPDSDSAKKTGICHISGLITEKLQEQGYTGSERTVRNYLRTKYHYVIHPRVRNND